jgi:eukaryotic-like serine/threonine-protein kinase
LFTIRKASRGVLQVLSLRDKKALPYGNIENAGPIDAIFSPDGRWVAYTSQETGKNEIFIQPFPATGAKYQIPRSADNHAPAWTNGGKELLYFIRPRTMGAVGISLQPGFAVGNLSEVFGAQPTFNAPTQVRDYDVSPDGKNIILPITPDQGQTANPSQQINIVLNWFTELQQRVPVR